MSEKPLWSAVAADANTEPVRIVDLDVARTTWSRVHESMRVVHLKLNRQPDLQWIRFFHEERESRINARRAGLWIEDGYIAFDCLLPDVETHHLPDIRRSLEFANERLLELVAARIRERGVQQAADRGERLELEQLRQRVRDLVDPRAGTLPAAPPANPAPRPERAADRRAIERRAAAKAAAVAPAPAPTPTPTPTPASDRPDAAVKAPPPAPPVASRTTTAPASAPANPAVPAPPATQAATPPEPESRSLESTLDDFRSALRKASERSRRGGGDPGEPTR